MTDKPISKTFLDQYRFVIDKNVVGDDTTVSMPARDARRFYRAAQANLAMRERTTVPIEKVEAGEKGSERWRKDKRVRKYLLAKRPQPTDLQRHFDYRSSAMVGLYDAIKANEPYGVVHFLFDEYWYALRTLREAGLIPPEDKEPDEEEDDVQG